MKKSLLAETASPGCMVWPVPLLSQKHGEFVS
jgi:hypothetical protein